MKYEMTICYPQHDDWDFDHFEADDLQECADYFHGNTMKYHSSMCDVTINGQKISVRNGRLLDNDYLPFSTNQAFHDIFAGETYPRVRVRA